MKRLHVAAHARSSTILRPAPAESRARHGGLRGMAWLLAGLDCGYEARSAVYPQQVTAVFTPEGRPRPRNERRDDLTA